MSSISAPAISPYTAATSLRPADTTTGGTTASSSTSSNSSQLSVTALGSTFLQLLTQELQNQDPTAPVDSTQMVGQMISLNQLDQLASINGTLSTEFPTAAAAAGSTGTATPTSGSQGAAAAGMSQASISAAVQAAMQALNASVATNSALHQVSLPSL